MFSVRYSVVSLKTEYCLLNTVLWVLFGFVLFRQPCFVGFFSNKLAALDICFGHFVVAVEADNNGYLPEAFVIYNRFVPGIAAAIAEQIVFFVGTQTHAGTTIITLDKKVDAGLVHILFFFFGIIAAK